MNNKLERPSVSVVYDFRGTTRSKDRYGHKIIDYSKEGVISVRVYYNGRTRMISTGVKVHPSEWDDIKYVVHRSDAATLNMIIIEQLNKCVETINGPESCEKLICAPMKVDRSDTSFLDWCRKRISQAELAPGTRRHHYCLVNKLEEFGKIKRFADVNKKNIEEFMFWIRENGARTQPTVHTYYKRLKRWIIAAIRCELIPNDVMTCVHVERGRTPEREYLTDEEIQIWRSVELKQYHLQRARDLFIIQMGCGMSFSDLISIDWSKRMDMNGHIVISGHRGKTGCQYFSVLLPMAVEILERWCWYIDPISNQKFNTYTKEIARIAGINKNVTSHIARHTYATQCLIHGVRLEAVQRTLGHSSIKTTQIYAKMIDEAVVDAFNSWK